MIGSRERARTFQGASRSNNSRPEAVAIVGVGAVVNFQPAVGSADRGGPGADAGAIPHARSRVCHATMIAPVHEVGRLGEPDVVAADVRAAGAVEGEVFAADLLPEDRAVFVVGRKDHAVMANVAPIGGAAQADADAVFRDCGEGEIVGLADLGHAAIFDTVRFEVALPEHRRVATGLRENRRRCRWTTSRRCDIVVK